LRNHHYTITISDVTSAGSNTPGDAYEGGGIAMSASVTAWNLATQNNVIDQQYILELDTTVAVLDYKGSIINIDVKTSSGKTWSIDTYLTNGVSAVVISNKIQIQNTNINPDKTEWDCGWIDVLVDNIKYRLKVVQEANPEHYPTTHNGWAGSNIYWDGTKLTFDDVNDHIHEKYQGVFFKWGSLWGIDPSGSNNALWSSNTNVVYKPEGSIETNVSWNSIPYCKPPTNSYPIAPKTGRDRHYLTEVHDPEKGLGDICKYLTERAGGTLHGKKWRMPTSTEFGINTDYQDYGGTWNLVNSFGSDGKFINSGKPGVTKASDIGIPFFSAAGYRSSIGELKSIGTYGFYWSASFTNSNAYILAISKVNILPASSLSFTLAASVRCVVE
ncbi:MAG: hypothetical protein PHT93_14960, partial [Massilibacteroides sp.]|nr:hypothetical protein [Massilibacteroides sp.]